MRKFMKSFATASVALAVIAAGSALYAADSQDRQMMGSGMTGHGDTMRQHRGMDHDGMMGMMRRMDRMMNHCSAMMRDGQRHHPNEQWRKHTPENKG
jgi:hypothetical protein